MKIDGAYYREILFS